MQVDRFIQTAFNKHSMQYLMLHLWLDKFNYRQLHNLNIKCCTAQCLLKAHSNPMTKKYTTNEDSFKLYVHEVGIYATLTLYFFVSSGLIY